MDLVINRYFLYSILAFVYVNFFIKLFTELYFYQHEKPKYCNNTELMVNINYFMAFYSEYDKHTDFQTRKIESERNNLTVEEYNDLFKFNEHASSQLPLLRKLPELRKEVCFKRIYSLNLPSASVIIIFRNEAYSTLIRTIVNVLTRSPNYLLREIILIDDNSDYSLFPYLSNKLNEFISTYQNIKIIKSNERLGVTRAKSLGAKHATGRVLVFLDSHCECFHGWLEPLLHSVKLNPLYAITPNLVAIHPNDFSVDVNSSEIGRVGSFDWNAEFIWINSSFEFTVNNYLTRSPTMAGGIYAIDRETFYKFGDYDQQMTYSGGENLEMSFRLWMCGSGIYHDPCSFVAHVFRDENPHSIPLESIIHNKHRAIEIWMEEYKHIIYPYLLTTHYNERAGSLLDRIKLKNDLKCNTFRWYLRNIATDVKIPGRPTQTNLCIDRRDYINSTDKIIRKSICDEHNIYQYFDVSKYGTIRYGTECVIFEQKDNKTYLKFTLCKPDDPYQKWMLVSKFLLKNSHLNLCLRVDDTDHYLLGVDCDIQDLQQRWSFIVSDVSYPL